MKKACRCLKGWISQNQKCVIPSRILTEIKVSSLDLRISATSELVGENRGTWHPGCLFSNLKGDGTERIFSSFQVLLGAESGLKIWLNSGKAPLFHRGGPFAFGTS